MAAPNFDTIGQVAQIQLTGVVAGQAMVTTFHYVLDQIISGYVTPLDVATNMAQTVWDDGAAGGLRYSISNGFTDAVVSAQCIYPVRFIPDVFQPGNTTGAVASPSLPPTNAMVVSRKSNRAGRKYRGRFFTPGVPTSFITNGSLNGTAATALAASIAAFALDQTVVGAFGSVIFRPVIFSLRAIANISEIKSHTIDSVLRVQRRREVGRGI